MDSKYDQYGSIHDPLHNTEMPWLTGRGPTMFKGAKAGQSFMSFEVVEVSDYTQYGSSNTSVIVQEPSMISMDESLIAVRESQIRFAVSVALGKTPKKPSRFSKIESRPYRYHDSLRLHIGSHPKVYSLAKLYVQWWRCAFFTSDVDVFANIITDLRARKGVHSDSLDRLGECACASSSSTSIRSVRQPVSIHGISTDDDEDTNYQGLSCTESQQTPKRRSVHNGNSKEHNVVCNKNGLLNILRSTIGNARAPEGMRVKSLKKSVKVMCRASWAAPQVMFGRSRSTRRRASIDEPDALAKVTAKKSYSDVPNTHSDLPDTRAGSDEEIFSISVTSETAKKGVFRRVYSFQPTRISERG
eukprot:CFRG2739T1